jgi:Ca2+/Na+ antiporter
LCWLPCFWAPELASSAMSLLNPNAGSEIGVGTIVGSAIFNILIIIGATVGLYKVGLYA